MFGNAELARPARGTKRDARLAVCRKNRKDCARRLHDSRESQLRRPFPRLSRRRYGAERKRFARPHDRAAADPLKTEFDTDHWRAACSKIAVERASCRGRTAGWMASIARIYPGPPIRQYSYVPHRSRRRTSKWRTSSSWRTGCFSRSSTRVSSHTNTRSRHKRNGRSTCRAICWGCDCEDDVRFDDHAQAHVRQASASVFRLRTLGDELDSAGLTWRFYTSQYGEVPPGVLVGVPGSEAHLLRTRLGERDHAAEKIPQRRQSRQARELYLDHAALH